ncbi:MAG: hypothetical protein JXR83_09570 [Deltaproteobacteria bacterium]|nr:hypothetical protein [Deltaproteobacteria bacterium]
MKTAAGMPSIVYEILVDRFKRSESDGGRGAPATWNGDAEDGARWGGDLWGVVEQLDYLTGLGVDTLVLSPVWPANSPLGEGLEDFFAIDPRLGGEPAFTALVKAAHARSLQLLLRGIFNRVGRAHPWFVEGMRQQPEDGQIDPAMRWRSFFDFGRPPYGHAAHRGCPELPELNLADHNLRHRLFHSDRSVVRTWLERGCRGWVVDSAEELGYQLLHDIQRAARTVDASCSVIADSHAFSDREVRDGVVDGVVNHYLGQALLAYAGGRIDASELSRLLEHQRLCYGSRGLAQCFNPLSSFNDGRALARLGGEIALTQLAVQLQFVLPGAATILYGDEIGLGGALVDAGRRPMQWDPARWDGDLRNVYRRMIELRRLYPALLTGDVAPLTPRGATDVFALARFTRVPRETIIAAFNRGHEARRQLLFVPVEGLVNGLPLIDVISGNRLAMRDSTVEVELPAQGAAILAPVPDAVPGYVFLKDR